VNGKEAFRFMDLDLNFLMEHWQLSAAFVVVLILLLVNEWRHRVFGLKQLDPQELVNMLNHEGAVVVDLRTRAQFDQGHIINAMHCPIAQLSESLSTLEKYKNKPILLVCASGLEIAKAGKLLKTAGYPHIYGLAGGMQAWESQQLPVVR
jgi:rhodanese-related sulfurtransferase